MKQKAFSTIVPTISLILFIIAIAHLLFGVVQETKGSSGLQKEKFETIFEKTKYAANSKLSHEEFMQDFEKSIGNISDFASLKLSISKVVVYDFVSTNPPKYTRSFSTSEDSDNGTISLSAQMSNAPRGTVHSHARIAFFLILAGTVLPIISLFTAFREKETDETEKKSEIDENKNGENIEDERNIYEYSAESKESEIEETAVIENDKTISEGEAEIEDKSIEANVIPDDEFADDEVDKVDESELADETQEEQTTDTETAKDNDEKTRIEKSDSENAEIEKSNIEESSAENQEKSVKEEIAEEPAQKNEEIADSESSENENAEQTISSENSLKADLGEHLRKNEYKEVSLTLIKLVTDDAQKRAESKEIIKAHFGKIAEFYDFDAETISVVQNGIDLEKTITDCENVLPLLEDIVEEGNAFLGISAMSYRAIPADRLIVEAEGALARAESDPKSPIVAFKANPDRYKLEIGNEIKHDIKKEENA